MHANMNTEDTCKHKIDLKWSQFQKKVVMLKARAELMGEAM